jgi:hypothetical protein
VTQWQNELVITRGGYGTWAVHDAVLGIHKVGFNPAHVVLEQDPVHCVREVIHARLEG